VRLFEGAIGPTRLAQATATACLDSQQRLAFDCHLEPAQARQTGHVKLSGSLPLTFTNQPSPVVTHSLAHACMHAFQSFVCLSIEASIHPVLHSFVHFFLHSFICMFAHLFVCSFIQSFIHSFIPSSMRLFIPSFIHSFRHSFMQSCIHSLMHFLHVIP